MNEEHMNIGEFFLPQQISTKTSFDTIMIQKRGGIRIYSQVRPKNSKTTFPFWVQTCSATDFGLAKCQSSFFLNFCLSKLILLELQYFKFALQNINTSFISIPLSTKRWDKLIQSNQNTKNYIKIHKLIKITHLESKQLYKSKKSVLTSTLKVLVLGT